MELATLSARDRDHHDKALTARATVGRVRHVGNKRYADLHPEARTSARWCRNHDDRSGGTVHDLIRDRSEKRAADGAAPGGADHDHERAVFVGDTEDRLRRRAVVDQLHRDGNGRVDVVGDVDGVAVHLDERHYAEAHENAKLSQQKDELRASAELDADDRSTSST